MENSDIKTKIVVLYHGNCPDGFGGAYAAWKHFGAKATYVPLYRHNAVPSIMNKEIYMIDFMYKEDATRELIKNNISVTGIDHHITAKESVALTKNSLFALDHSGAVLGWKYFHPKTSIPRLLRHIEDIDLWKFTLPHTKEIMAELDLLPFDFKKWDSFARDLENTKKRTQIIKDGKNILRFKDKLVETIAITAEKVQFMGYRILAVNSSVFNSELGAWLMREVPPLAIIWHRTRGKIIVSLRSNGKVDVSQVAEKFGGGGHKGAAGFILEGNEAFPWMPIK